MNYLIISFLFVFFLQIQQVVSGEFRELISDPISFTTQDSQIVQNADLPLVKDELSLTLNLKILSHNPNWACVFHKGGSEFIRTPALWLTPVKSQPHVRFSTNINTNAGIDAVGNGLSLNQWYHLAYTLSEPKKRLDFYMDGQWVGFQSIQQVQVESIIFNDKPLYIGNDTNYNAITGQMKNFRYYNWYLSAEEVAKAYLNTGGTAIPTSSQSLGSASSPPMTSPSQSPIPTPTPNDAGTMAGIGIGASLGSIALTIGCFYLYKKRQESRVLRVP